MEKKCPCYVEGKITEKRMDMSKALFITGTGTDIGKTYVTGLIVKKLAEEGKSAAYYKAAMSGNDRRADIRWRWLWSEMATGQYVINMIM